MTILEAVLQAVLQGITEFLPVSSSGHLSLFQHFFGINGEAAVTTSIVLHLGTLVAVFVAFHHLIWQLILEFFSMVKDIFTGKFKWKTMNPNRRMIIMIIISILPLFGFYLIKDIFMTAASDDDIVIEGLAFLYTSAILFLSDKFQKNEKAAGETTAKDALVIGVMQGIALTPGISRSGSTIAGGLFCGLKRESAVEYSFILGIPVIIAGALTDLLDFSPSEESVSLLPLIIGFVVAAVVGYLAIKLLRWIMKSNKFRVFAFYTLALGVIVVALGTFEHISGMRICIG